MNNKQFKTSRILFYISLVLFIIITAFFLYLFFDILKNSKNASDSDQESTGSGFSKALYLVFLGVYGSIGYAICIVLNTVSYVLQRKSGLKDEHKKWNAVTLTSIFIPAFVESILILIIYLI